MAICGLTRSFPLRPVILAYRPAESNQLFRLRRHNGRSHERHTNLVLPIEDGRYGDALFSFVQALLRITDVTYLLRWRQRSGRLIAPSPLSPVIDSPYC